MGQSEIHKAFVSTESITCAGGLVLSVSSKLADYESTWELLSRLSFDELRLLAKRNGVALQKEDAYGNVQKARSKEEAADNLIASEFKESDVIELLGVNRLTKEELLHVMSTQQLHQLAKETGVLLEKPKLLWTRRAVKKKDVVNVLKVLSEQKVREYAKRIGLLRKAKKRTKKKRIMKTHAKKSLKKATTRKKMQKAKAFRPPVRKQILPVPESALVAKEEPPIIVPYERAQTKTASITEVTIKERLMEREVVRRQLALGRRREERGAKMKEAEKVIVEAKKAKKDA